MDIPSLLAPSGARPGSKVDSMVQRASSETDPAPKQASLPGLRYLSLPYHSYLMVLCLSASAYLHRSSLNTTSFPPFSAICRRPPHTPDSIDWPYYKAYHGFPIPLSSTKSEISVSLPSYLHLHITISPQPDISGLSRLLPSLLPRHICTQSRSDFLLTPVLDYLAQLSPPCAIIPNESTHAATSAGSLHGGVETTP